MSFTILTVNTHKGFGFLNRRFILHELREAVRSVSADIVFLQEVMGEHELHSARVTDWPTAPHYEFLADTLWKEFAYGRNAVYPEGHHGNALLSKFPIVSFENRDVSQQGREQRGLLHCVLRLPGDTLHAVCVHLGLAEAQRRREIELLCGLIDELPRGVPLLVAGDFNDWNERLDAPMHAIGLHRAELHPGAARLRPTFPSRVPVFALDRVYTRGFHCVSFEVPRGAAWARMSDHLPLVAELTLA